LPLYHIISFALIFKALLAEGVVFEWLEWLFVRQTWTLYLHALVLISTTALAILLRLKFIREEG